MRRLGSTVALVLVGAAVALGAELWWRASRAPRLPDPPALVERIREVARLETLDVRLYKKVTFAPDPPAPSDSFWGNVASWAKFQIHDPNGKAIVFAEAHLGLDLTKLDAKSLRVDGERVTLTLPPMAVKVELLPGETEVVGGNLDAAEMAQLLDLAKSAFQREVEGDARLRERAHSSAERALRAVFVTAGFREVQFDDAANRF